MVHTVRNEHVRLGIVGFGYWGPNLLRNFSKVEDCIVTAVADTRLDRLVNIRRTHPHIEVYGSMAELLEAGDVHAVAIATPVSTHYVLGKEALEAGVHVLLEKPVARTAGEARSLTELAARVNRVLMVDHTFVYSGAVRKIRTLIENGEIGELYYYDSIRVNLGLFQNDVSVLWDLGAHDFSIMQYLIDAEPLSVSAVGASPVRDDEWGLASLAYVTVQFVGGMLAHLDLNWLSPVKVRRTLIGGSRKMIVYDHLDPDNQVKIFDKGIAWQGTSRSETLVQYRIGDMIVPKVDQTEALESACRHFVECIVAGRQPLTDGLAGLRVVRLLEAAEQSMAKGGETQPL